MSDSSGLFALPGTFRALLSTTLRDWLPGVAGSEPRLGFRFLGRQLRKGGLHQPPFFFFCPFQLLKEMQVVTFGVLVKWCLVAGKKVSGRWGFRPLGRGDGGKRNPKLVQFFPPSCCAREQQTSCRSVWRSGSRNQLPITAMNSACGVRMGRWTASPITPVLITPVHSTHRLVRSYSGYPHIFLEICLYRPLAFRPAFWPPAFGYVILPTHA